LIVDRSDNTAGPVRLSLYRVENVVEMSGMSRISAGPQTCPFFSFNSYDKAFNI